MATAPTPTRERHQEPFESSRSDLMPVWNVVVWDDPVNLMSYVVWVFRKLFGHSENLATKLMLLVHNEGRAIVMTEPRERAEMDAHLLHRHGLWATLERA